MSQGRDVGIPGPCVRNKNLPEKQARMGEATREVQLDGNDDVSL